MTYITLYGYIPWLIGSKHPRYDNRMNDTMGLAMRAGGYWSVQNWLVPEVRNYKTQLLQEVITMYKPDGISLDFLRAPIFFNTTTTTSAQRRRIMGGWVRDLRARMKAGGRDK
jgi:hypothetical protein